MAYPVYALKCLRGILTRYPKIPTECHVMCSEEHSLQNIALLSLISIRSREVVKISITQKVTISSRKKCSRKRLITVFQLKKTSLMNYLFRSHHGLVCTYLLPKIYPKV